MGDRRWDLFQRSAAGVLAVGIGFFCTLAPKAPVGSNDVPTGLPAGVTSSATASLAARAAVEPVALDAALATASVTSSAILGSVTDGWSSISRFRTADGWFATPVHATLLADGRILFTGIARKVDPPVAGTPQRRVSWIMSVPGLGPLPAELSINEVTEPVTYGDPISGTSFISDDLICSGQTLTADGSVVTAGGTRAQRFTGDPNLYVRGLATETKFDGTSWTQYPGTMQTLGPTGTAAKWYPTVTRLPNANLLVTGGYEVVGPGPQPVPAVETLDPTTGARTVFADRSVTPTQITNRDYTHVFVLPFAHATNDLLMIGEQSVPELTGTSTPGVFSAAAGRPGYTGTVGLNWGTTDVMLPIRVQNGQWGYDNGSIFEASGNMGSQYEHRGDVFDPVTLTWRSPIDLGVMRHHPSSVVLPDGRILLVNGHDKALDARVQQAEYIDPSTGFSVSLGTATEGVVRGYHSVALLLPDGRVLVGGGRDQDTDTSLEKPTWQFYYPDYLTKPRPAIASAPTQINYGSLFAVSSTGPKPAETVLIGLGSMTHSFDSDQRSVQLPVGQVSTNSAGASLTIAGGPTDSHVAPPGYYMLFLLDANRVPSVAKIVHIG